MATPDPQFDELSILMDLRLAFGPGSRLWALRSREELCYDWLRFKARAASADFRGFTLELYSYEKACRTERLALCEIRRRVAAILRAHRIKRPSPAPVRARSGSIVKPVSLMLETECTCRAEARNHAPSIAATKSPAPFRPQKDAPAGPRKHAL